MISQLLLASDPPNSPQQMLERTKQVQQAASMAFKDICVGGKHSLQELGPVGMNQLNLYWVLVEEFKHRTLEPRKIVKILV